MSILRSTTGFGIEPRRITLNNSGIFIARLILLVLFIKNGFSLSETESPAYSYREKPNKFIIATLPAKDSDTLSIKVKFCEPLNQNKPFAGFNLVVLSST